MGTRRKKTINIRAIRNPILLAALVRPVESGTVLTEDGGVSGEPLSCGGFEFALGAPCLTSFITPLGVLLEFVCNGKDWRAHVFQIVTSRRLI